MMLAVLYILTVGVLSYHLLEPVLSVIPANWGSVDEDGEWQGTRDYIQFTGAALGGLIITYKLEIQASKSISSAKNESLPKDTGKRAAPTAPQENAQRTIAGELDEQAHTVQRAQRPVAANLSEESVQPPNSVQQRAVRLAAWQGLAAAAKVSEEGGARNSTSAVKMIPAGLASSRFAFLASQASEYLPVGDDGNDLEIELESFLQSIPSIKHSNANVKASRVNIPQGSYFEFEGLDRLSFSQDKDGMLAAIFVIEVLPTIGVYWHGYYGRDHKLVVGQSELIRLAVDELKCLPVGEAAASALAIASGVTLLQEGEKLIAKILVKEASNTLFADTLCIEADGHAALFSREQLLAGNITRTLY